jgi:diguanylate cyclase (GGDEF)-like protein
MISAGTGVFSMMLNSYLPNRLRRYAFAGLAIGSMTALALSAGDSFAGVSSIQAVISASVSPLSLALCAVPSAVAILLAALGFRQSRLARQLGRERANADSLRHAAYHDNLTGLRNRHALTEDVGSLSAKGRRAILLFDLDRFKFINDTMGHAAGDAVLKALARRIASVCGQTQTIYRLGGDEFVVLWDNAPGEDEISRFCDGLAETVFQPVEYGNYAIEIAGSIGIAVAEGRGITLSAALKHADLALYRAKETPGCSHCFFSDDMDSDYRLRRDLAADMRAGLTEGAFNVDYLPVFEAGSLAPKGFSAKLKWTHPAHGNVAPELFLPMAEESGLVVMIGKWLLGQALADAADWHEDADIIIPVSPAQLSDPGFVDDVSAALRRTGVAPERLVCDIRANAVAAADRIAMAAIDRLRGLGVKVAVSDFSAGIAGLAMTRPHPVDLVRLDLEHVKAIAGEARFAQMLSLFLQLASTVETPVILTGVDSQADLECAIAAGATEIEGRFAGPSLSADQVSAIFRKRETVAPRPARLAS